MKLAGKPKRELHAAGLDQALYDKIAADVRAELTDALNTAEVREARKLQPRRRSSRRSASKRCRRRAAGRRPASCFDALKERIFRDEMLKERRRPDGRAFDEIRPITIEVGVLPRTHGSALFTRGETQALVTVTLGTKEDEQRIELLEPGETSQALHAALQLPAVQRRRSRLHARPGPPRNRPRRAGRARARRRDSRTKTKFPYTLRVVSDILESNGSSSMATRLRRALWR